MTMDWIVTTGPTVEAALDIALDELSVTQEDIEFEVVKEPKNSLFGSRRNRAQVRARIRPVEPPAKREWRRPAKSDKRKKAKKQGQKPKTRPTKDTDRKRPETSGVNRNKKTAKSPRKENKTAANTVSHENGQASKAPNIRKRTITSTPEQTNVRSIDDRNDSPQPEPTKVRRTRKIDH